MAVDGRSTINLLHWIVLSIVALLLRVIGRVIESLRVESCLNGQSHPYYRGSDKLALDTRHKNFIANYSRNPRGEATSHCEGQLDNEKAKRTGGSSCMSLLDVL